MKKLIFLILLITATSKAQIVNIPDANFKTKLLFASPTNSIASTQTPIYNATNGSWTVSSYNKIDSNNDGIIQLIESQAVKYLNVSYSSIANLEGIESFTSLQYLNCKNNQILSLNVSLLTNLIHFNCSFNQLPSLNVSGLGSLKYLSCNNNQITNLNIIGLSNLQNLACYYNLLTSMNVSGLTNLKYFRCSYNQLTSLNVSSLYNLLTFDCSHNQLPSLNVSGLTSLYSLTCNNNQLQTLNASELINLIYLYCHYNLLSSFNINNGSIENDINFIYNSNLNFICVDLTQVVTVQAQAGPNVIVNSECSLLGVDENRLRNAIDIFPNPTSSIINVNCIYNIKSIELFDIEGRVLFTKIISDFKSSFDISRYSNGIYILKINTIKGSNVEKIIKE